MRELTSHKLDQEKFEAWAVVEVMGHNRFVGFVTEQTIGGASFVRVDVPASGSVPAFTKILGASSIYAITPCTEETARAFVAKGKPAAFSLYEAPRLPALGNDAPEDFVDDMDESDDSGVGVIDLA